jgi:membrane fusion protein, heavy metal efflux system
VTEDRSGSHLPGRTLPRRVQAVAVIALVVVAAGGFALLTTESRKAPDSELSSQAKRSQRFYRPSEAEWATLATETVKRHEFRTEHVTEGKIAVDEDRSTPIFSPYAGRVTKLLAKPGDSVTVGQPLFIVEATDMVQAQNDFIGAITAMNKARSQLDLAQIVEKRNKELYEGKAVALKEWQQAQAGLIAAQNDVRSAETALEAARNRLRILGRTAEEIAAFQDKGRISPETSIFAPIGGTIVQRKVGPGQYVSASATFRPSGSPPMCARPRRRACGSARRSSSPCSPIPGVFSEPPSTMLRRCSIRQAGASWCAPRSTIRTSC